MFAINLIPWRSRVHESETDEFTPRQPLTRFRSEMDRLFDRFWGEPLAGTAGFPADRWQAFGWSPSLDVTEHDNEVAVRAEMPGVDPEDLDLSISGDVLTLSGEKKESSEERDGNFFRAERRFGSFRRSIQLPASVDPDKVEAEYENGVLTVRMEKAETAKPKRIPVKTTA